VSGSIFSSYKKLMNRTKDLIVLSSAKAIIHWDMETKMPPKALEQRSQQLALLSRIRHKISTSPEIGILLSTICTSPRYDALGELEKRNVYLIKKNYEEQTALPEKIVAEIAKQQAINKVTPSNIRIEADGVIYNLHVIIRFQIEKDLFTNKTAVAELPEIWNNKYKDQLGTKVENDAEGVMQDTHWVSELYGYFPTYALGNIYSGQLLTTLARDIQDWRLRIAQGKLRDIGVWLAKNVHSYGDMYASVDLIERSGKKLDSEPYLQYLGEKYGELYGF
jgi:Zn-dependent M32 family carboxypeptidase